MDKLKKAMDSNKASKERIESFQKLVSDTTLEWGELPLSCSLTSLDKVLQLLITIDVDGLVTEFFFSPDLRGVHITQDRDSLMSEGRLFNIPVGLVPLLVKLVEKINALHTERSKSITNVTDFTLDDIITSLESIDTFQTDVISQFDTLVLSSKDVLDPSITVGLLDLRLLQRYIEISN